MKSKFGSKKKKEYKKKVGKKSCSRHLEISYMSWYPVLLLWSPFIEVLLLTSGKFVCTVQERRVMA